MTRASHTHPALTTGRDAFGSARVRVSQRLTAVASMNARPLVERYVR
jgi:hypothetical protein